MEDNILIVGLGSIGTRHLNNLVKLGFNKISIVTKLGKVKEGFENFDFYSSIGKACLDKKIHTVVIATPTSRHIDDLLGSLDNNIQNIYLEKPISSSLKNIDKIKEMLSHLSINLVVGYDLRFDPGLILMKKYINKGVIGNIVSFISEVGQYLPDWRPGIDYRKSMSACKNQGGGVMLDLVHEFDYINWLVGPIKSVVGMNGKISNLEIDTEDISVNLIETSSGVLGSIHLDYLQCELSRSCKIIGDKGVMVWNYKNSTLKIITHKEKVWKTYDFSIHDRNDRFIDIMSAFMESRFGRINTKLVSFEDAIASIALVDLSKKSYKSGHVEVL